MKFYIFFLVVFLNSWVLQSARADKEYGLRARAGFEKNVDACGGYKKHFVLGLGFGKYGQNSDCSPNYSGACEPVNQGSGQWNNYDYASSGQPNVYQSYAPWRPRGSRPYSSEMYNTHTNPYDGISRYNQEGIKYHPSWY